MLRTIKNQMIVGVLLLILILQVSAATIQYLQARSVLMEGLESEAKNITTPLIVDIERKSDLMETATYNFEEFFEIHIRLASIFSFKALINEQEKLEDIRFVDAQGVIKAHWDQLNVNRKLQASLLPMIGKSIKSLELNDQIHVFIPSYFKGSYNGGMLLSYTNRQMVKARTRIVVISAGLLLFYMLIGGITTVLLSRKITRPIAELSKSFGMIAAGDLNHEITINRSDELGSLAKSFSAMRDAIIEKIKLKDQAQQETLRMQEQTVGELKRLDKLKDEFLAKTSHELRTPLHGIMGISELLFDQAGQIDSERLKKELKMIYVCGKRLSTTIDDILDYSQLKNRALTLVPKPVRLKGQVQMIIDLFTFLTKGKNVKLLNEVSASAIVCADENRLQQILQNLIGNAVKFTPEGWIVVRSSVIGAMIEVEVTDSGIGIAKKQHEQIFKSFEQADSSLRNGTSAGTGLGLSITKHLVELHGGTIRVLSETGAGASFFFTLPKAANEAVAPDSERHILNQSATGALALNQEKQKTILVVEDEPTVRHVIVANLQDQYHIIEAVNGQDGWEKLSAGIPDLILLDLMLPILDGFGLCEKIRADNRFKQIPIVILTAKSMIDDFAIALQLGANDFLRKPIGRETLLARVKNNLPENRNRITAPGCWTIYCHLDKIVYIHSEKTGSRIYLEGTERTIEIDTCFATIRDEFETQLFSPHQNYLINTSKKAWIRSRTVWDFELVFADGKVVPISRRIFPTLKDKYEKLKHQNP